MAALDNGGSAAVWSDIGNDGSGYGIFGGRFDVSGTAIDANDFQVNYAISRPLRNVLVLGFSRLGRH